MRYEDQILRSVVLINMESVKVGTGCGRQTCTPGNADTAIQTSLDDLAHFKNRRFVSDTCFSGENHSQKRKIFASFLSAFLILVNLCNKNIKILLQNCTDPLPL